MNRAAFRPGRRGAPGNGDGQTQRSRHIACGVHRPDGLDRIIVETGTSVCFTYSTHHDVWQVPTLDAIERCDMSGATQLAGRAAGGGCEDRGGGGGVCVGSSCVSSGVPSAGPPPDA